jgi:hypothetical protein
MEPKKLYFLLSTATTVGVIAGAMGGNVVFSDSALQGYRQTVPLQDIVRPTPVSVAVSIENMIASQSCPAIDAKYGVASCDSQAIDYDIVYHRKRGREWVARRYPQFEGYFEREQTAPVVSAWINNKLDNTYCERANARYGGSVCDSETIDYVLRFIRTSGQTRTIIDLEAPVFCTTIPPVDPTPPSPGI